MPDVLSRLESIRHARVGDVGCGQGFSTIAVARAFLDAHVDGLDADPASVEDARRHAAEAGLDGRVRFIEADAAQLADHGPYDLILVLDALHDLARPAEALRAARAALAAGGTLLVVGERVADRFTAPGDEVERTMFGWSVTHCLPTQMAEQPSAALGTAMRADTVRAGRRRRVQPLRRAARRQRLLPPLPTRPLKRRRAMPDHNDTTTTTQHQWSTTMHATTTTTTTSTRPRRRLGRLLLAAAVAACVLPAAAQAGTVEEAADGTLVYRAAAGESNNLSVTNGISGAVSIRDLTGLTERTPLCDAVSSIRVNCTPGARLSEVHLGDRNDGFAIGIPMAGVVDGGPGNDSYTASNPTLASRVDYRGGDGFDHVSYNNANRGVRISNDGVANDGRIGFDQDNIGGDVERLEGSAFGDEITAAASSGFGQVLTGGPGNDVLRDAAVRSRAFSADTVFDMGRRADGADDIIGGSAHSQVDYSQRTQPVNVTLNFGGADDGEQVEGDEITGSNEFVNGGQADDTIRAPAGSTAAHTLNGFGGNDRIEGADGADTLSGGDSAGFPFADGEDTLLAHGGNDLILARDGVGDTVGCGLGTDTAELDPNTLDISAGCENRRVGALRVTPKRLGVEAGAPARLQLSWRHPRSWRQLRRVELRLYRGDAGVGAVAISPRSRRIADRGAVTVLRHSRLANKGKTVSARLALRLDRKLAGRRLRLEVEAVDVRGARQLERRAGSIHVSR